MMTPEEYIEGLERAGKNLHQIKNNWHKIDTELCIEYECQLEWLLEKRDEFLNKIKNSHKLVLRFHYAMIELRRHEEFLNNLELYF